ncbi:FG-GAP repeat domain-containing protein [Microbacterium sp. LWO12-1.2]|uniref:FG-GAP repeat domain-containing protein n=1 Tax=Microbacterium sp. LWO12-1.2 TaxID=3135261 RepID=UPI003438B05A
MTRRNQPVGEIGDYSFEDFRQGTLGNGGQNIYLSKAGVLQRISYSSISGSGYVDLPFANSHDDGPVLPAYVYVSPLLDTDRVELDSLGAYAGATADLNGNGLDDIVIANQFDGVTNELHAQIYYAGADGYSRSRMQQLWAPSSKDVVIGRFTSRERPAIILLSRERLRLFEQGSDGFASHSYRDLTIDLEIESIVAADLDGDGFDDLIVRCADSAVIVFWGGADGLSAERSTRVPAEYTGTRRLEALYDLAAMGGGGGTVDSATKYVQTPQTEVRLKVIDFMERPSIFLCPEATTYFVRFDEARNVHLSAALDTGPVISAASGPVLGAGRSDLVLVTHQDEGQGQVSRLYPHGAETSELGASIAFETAYANDVVIADLDGNGYSDVIVCQGQRPDHYTTEALVFPSSDTGFTGVPNRLPTHCAQDVLMIRWPLDGLPKPVFINHLSNTVRGDVNTFVYLGAADGFSADRRLEFPGWAATELKFVDFWDRGAPDIFMANSNENWLETDKGSFIYVRRSDEFPIEDRIELATTHNMSGVVADFSRSGYLDLVTSSWEQSYLQLFRGGPEGLAEPERIDLVVDGRTYADARFMSVADLNKDGWLDLVVPDLGRGGVLILWGGPDGFDANRSVVLESGKVVSTRVADLNNDGWLDLIVGGYKGDDPTNAHNCFVYIYWGGPEGYSNSRRAQLPSFFAADVSVADLNNDGVLDIIVANYVAHQTRDIDSYIYWGDENGEYHPHRVTRLFHHSACGILAADFNEDGYIDLAIANHRYYGNHDCESYVWHNGPDGFSESHRTSLPTGGAHGLSHLDFGNIYDRGPEEFFESRVFRSNGVLKSIRVEGSIPAKTWVRSQVRTAAAESELATSPWRTGEVVNGWLESEEATDIPLEGFVQYRLAFGATNSVATPRVSAVELRIVELQDDANVTGKVS